MQVGSIFIRSFRSHVPLNTTGQLSKLLPKFLLLLIARRGGFCYTVDNADMEQRKGAAYEKCKTRTGTVYDGGHRLYFRNCVRDHLDV